MSPEPDSVRCSYGSRLKSNRFLAQGKRKKSKRLSRNSGAEGRHVEASRCLRVFLKAAKSSGLDQRQVAEETTAAVYTHTVTLPLATLCPRRPASCTPWYFDHRVLAHSSHSHVSLVSNAQSEGLCAPSPLHQMVAVFSELLFGILAKISFSWNRWETQNNEIAANKSFVDE